MLFHNNTIRGALLLISEKTILCTPVDITEHHNPLFVSIYSRITLYIYIYIFFFIFFY